MLRNFQNSELNKTFQQFELHQQNFPTRINKRARGAVDGAPSVVQQKKTALMLAVAASGHLPYPASSILKNSNSQINWESKMKRKQLIETNI